MTGGEGKEGRGGRGGGPHGAQARLLPEGQWEGRR